jgi:hypothetical protein
MSKLPEIHLCIVQPAGYVHSLGLVDQARYFRYQFRRLGANVSLAKNRLRHDAVNFVFGAHLGFDATQCQRHACVFVNLEQLGEGGATVSDAYRQLLRQSAVVDYDADNVAAYSDQPDAVPVVPLLHAPYLASPEAMPLEERPIDLLFFGSMNERRRASGPHRSLRPAPSRCSTIRCTARSATQFIAQAKAVLNCSLLREQPLRAGARVALPVAGHAGDLRAHRRGRAARRLRRQRVLARRGDQLEQLLPRAFRQRPISPTWHAPPGSVSAPHDPIDAYADLLAFAAGFVPGAPRSGRATEPWRPAFINLGSGKDYKPGWLNLDVLDRAEPDLVLDLGRPVAWPVHAPLRFGGRRCWNPAACRRSTPTTCWSTWPTCPR